MADKPGKSKHLQSRVHPPFHQRFDIEVGMEDARKRFMNRISNGIADSFRELDDWSVRGDEVDDMIMRHVASRLGHRYDRLDTFSACYLQAYYDCLRAVEALHEALGMYYLDRQEYLDRIVRSAISMSEVDIGIEWKDGVFYRTGAALLDEALVNENLRWLSDNRYHEVLAPFQKGMRHYLEAQSDHQKLADTITDLYEALEALAKVVTGRPTKELSGNRELFVSKLKLSQYWSKMLDDYIEYACQYRHGVARGQNRPLPSPNEVEAFVYTTGMFIRLAIQQISI